MPQNELEGLSRRQAQYRTRLEQMQTEASAIAGSARKIAEAIQQALSNGGMIHVQPQIAGIISGMARIQKDLGVVEYFQNEGISQRKPPRK